MKLQELIHKVEIKPNFESYLRHSKDSGMKAMDVSKLEMEKFIIDNGQILKSVLFIGDAGLMINYKNKNGVGLSFSEQDDGETWEIESIKKAESSKTMRVVKSVDWRRLLADTMKTLSSNPESEVKRIILKPLHNISEVVESKHERVIHNYQDLVNQLNMQFSEDINKFIVEIRKNSLKVF